MTHLTLNTGHSMNVPHGKVSEKAIHVLTPMVTKGGDNIPFCAPWRTVISIEDGSAVFDIRKSDEHVILVNAVAWTKKGASEVWTSLRREYINTASKLASQGFAQSLDLPEMPKTVPWLATWILPHASMFCELRDILWMADFEQCLAATIIRVAAK